MAETEEEIEEAEAFAEDLEDAARLDEAGPKEAGAAETRGAGRTEGGRERAPRTSERTSRDRTGRPPRTPRHTELSGEMEARARIAGLAAEEQTVRVEETEQAERVARAEKIAAALAEADVDFMPVERKLGADRYVEVMRAPDTKAGDLIRINILDESRDTVLDLWQLLPAGTKLVAGDRLDYRRGEDAVTIPIGNSKFMSNLDQGMFHVIHMIARAHMRDFVAERNLEAAEAAVIAAHKNYEAARASKVPKEAETRARSRVVDAEKILAKMHAAAYRNAWNSARDFVLNYRKERNLDLAPAFPDKAALDAEIKKILERSEAEHIAVVEGGGSVFTGAKEPRGADLPLRRKWTFGRVGFGVLIGITAGLIVMRDGASWLWRNIMGKEQKGGDKKSASKPFGKGGKK